MVHYAANAARYCSASLIAVGDTIAALATPPGRGAVGVVRVSGPLSTTIAQHLCGRCPPPRHASLVRFRGRQGVVLDHGLVIFFPGPHSYTGEDVLELQAHGGPVVLGELLAHTIALGARAAAAGEFTRRAYLNGKLDLAQAEAVADLISSTSLAAARAAARSLEGEFSHKLNNLAEALTDLRVVVEAGLDFPDEDVPLNPPSVLTERLQKLRERLAVVRKAAGQGRILQEGARLVLLGAPNVGKSSLLNRLAGYAAAIVTPLPGTTRDVLREALVLDGVPVVLADTAGFRDTSDVIEQEGVRRARQAGSEADHVLFVTTSQAPEALPDEWLTRPGVALTRIINKTDVPGVPGPPWPGAHAACVDVAVSAVTGDGIAELVARITAAAGLQPEGAVYGARRRHTEALDRAAAALDGAAGEGAELVAEALRLAASALHEITGAEHPEALLDAIFSRFCIGK